MQPIYFKTYKIYSDSTYGLTLAQKTEYEKMCMS